MVKEETLDRRNENMGRVISKRELISERLGEAVKEGTRELKELQSTMGVTELDKVKLLEEYVDIESEAGDYNRNLITVEHRSENANRDFLFVNKKQGKFISTKPSEIYEMCDTLGEKVSKVLKDTDKVLVIGFTESALTISTIVGEYLEQCKYIMHTTREDIGSDFAEKLVSFEEGHSLHSTHNLLSWRDEDRAVNLEEIDYILFIEDEVSTGSTILNIITQLKKVYGENKFKYGVGTICNLQDEESEERFRSNGVQVVSLIKGRLRNINQKMNITTDDIVPQTEVITEITKEEYRRKRKNYSNYLINRLGWNVSNIEDVGVIKVIGTEECVIDAVRFGYHLEQLGYEVVVQATTRTKLDILNTHEKSSDGVRSRHTLSSAYCDGIDTYIYNIEEEVGMIVLVTDSLDREKVNKTYEQLVTLANCKVILIEL